MAARVRHARRPRRRRQGQHARRHHQERRVHAVQLQGRLQVRLVCLFVCLFVVIVLERFYKNNETHFGSSLGTIKNKQAQI